jgi:hypothetical protein
MSKHKHYRPVAFAEPVNAVTTPAPTAPVASPTSAPPVAIVEEFVPEAEEAVAPVGVCRADNTPRVLSPAEQKMHELVFGVGFQFDANGRPIERGHGAPSHPCSQPRAPVTQITDAHRKVFGADVTLDANGFPIETGIGTRNNPHKQPGLG